MTDQNASQGHLVTLEEADIDGRPQQRPCACPLGRNHFFDEPVEPSEKSNVSADLAVPRYRDDTTVCLYTRFGRQHERHTYSFVFPEANGVGWYDCPGLSAEEAGHPYPKRPVVRTGMLADDLVDDLVEWWHVYGTSEVWGPGDQVLPLALDAAARVFVTHIVDKMTAEVERKIERARVARQNPGENAKTLASGQYWRMENGRIARVWPKDSPEPDVPSGFDVCRILNGRMETASTFTKAVLGGWWWLDDQRFTWQENIQHTPLVDVRTSRARRWGRDEPEPDMPQGFEVARRMPQNSFRRYVRLNNGRQDHWVAKDGGDWHTWEDIWYGPGDGEVIEVMPGDDDD